jgi:hypothetical protein
VYDTGGLRRTHLRGHRNILKRVLVHASGFNLGLVMRRLIGVGTPRGLQSRLTAQAALWYHVTSRLIGYWMTRRPDAQPMIVVTPCPVLMAGRLKTGTCTTGC